MEIPHILALARYYDDRLGIWWAAIHGRDIPVVENEDAAQDEEIMSHIRWMCGEINRMLTEGHPLDTDVEKASRWMGFIQGVLWMLDVFSISELRDHSRAIENVPETPWEG